ncbi:hypothetical protein AMAG_07823 [Allomyces macrogynus ATCC 38327]|uniref:Uncharacterized protein n=1 Tax=Allomyces macrogynus (strain ATCC 38327) TaxID=578462 RepID=A0A0L0SJE3_ALLM3|nr:hypothetical protein AMAG_07823 [Allomyces macrogynus ATCC 38327]|eukprot:KNE62623.1 hypothetical protein AMAG_07823 [Allomyces macrogynus ATCC 38327]
MSVATTAFPAPAGHPARAPAATPPPPAPVADVRFLASMAAYYTPPRSSRTDDLAMQFDGVHLHDPAPPAAPSGGPSANGLRFGLASMGLPSPPTAPARIQPATATAMGGDGMDVDMDVDVTAAAGLARLSLDLRAVPRRDAFAPWSGNDLALPSPPAQAQPPAYQWCV